MTTLLGDLPEHARLISKLEHVCQLPRSEAGALLALEVSVRNYSRGEDIAVEGDRPRHSSLLLSGFACRYKYVPAGKRQISAFHIGGDLPDLQSLHLHTMDHSLGALVETRVAAIRHEALLEAITPTRPSATRFGGTLWSMRPSIGSG